MNEVGEPQNQPPADRPSAFASQRTVDPKPPESGSVRLKTRVMGVLNTTPDSFSDGGRFLGHAEAIDHGTRLFAAGATVVDVGGESTRPGARPVQDKEQIRRVAPVIEALAELGEVSIDTRSEVVARAAIGAGATIINDVSASLERVAADTGSGWVAMHMRGTPETMQRNTAYCDVVESVSAFLLERARKGTELGIERIWIDPGFGFGKTPVQNLELLAATDRLAASGYRVVVGTSRKSTLGVLAAALRAGMAPLGSRGQDIHPEPASDRLEMSIVTALLAASLGADMVRVHDVEATLAAFAAFNHLLGPTATGDLPTPIDSASAVPATQAADTGARAVLGTRAGLGNRADACQHPT